MDSFLEHSFDPWLQNVCNVAATANEIVPYKIDSCTMCVSFLFFGIIFDEFSHTICCICAIDECSSCLHT